jgi:hypothetical protein
MSATQEQATFVKVAEHLFRNESSGTYYARAKRGGKRFHAALRMESAEGIQDQALAKRALRKWLDDLDTVNADAYRSGEAFCGCRETQR